MPPGVESLSRDRPEPSRMRSAGMPLAWAKEVAAASPALHVPAPETLRPMDLTRISACMLLLSFMNGMRSSLSGID